MRQDIQILQILLITLRKFRNQFPHGRFQGKFSLILPFHQSRDRGRNFSNGRQIKDIRLFQRLFGFIGLVTKSLVVNHLAFFGNQYHNPRSTFDIDCFLSQRIHLLIQIFTRNAHRFRKHIVLQTAQTTCDNPHARRVIRRCAYRHFAFCRNSTENHRCRRFLLSHPILISQNQASQILQVLKRFQGKWICEIRQDRFRGRKTLHQSLNLRFNCIIISWSVRNSVQAHQYDIVIFQGIFDAGNRRVGTRFIQIEMFHFDIILSQFLELRWEYPAIICLPNRQGGNFQGI